MKPQDAIGRVLGLWERHPRARARTYAAFLAAHLLLTAPLAVMAAGWDGGWSSSSFTQLNFDTEGTAANLYSGVLWTVVAALGFAQLRCSTPTQPFMWRWTTGWACLGMLATLVAIEELIGLKDTHVATVTLERLAPLAPRWLPKDAYWLVVVAPLTAPLAVAAGWALYTSQRHHPVRALLTVLAAVLLVGAQIIDGLDPLYDWPTRVWLWFVEEGSEVLASALLVVVLSETLLDRARLPSAHRVPSAGSASRWAAVGVSMALLAASGPALLTEYDWDDEELVRPNFYSGPVALMTQTFRANRDGLTRIGIWAFAQGGNGAEAQVFARLISEEADAPLRESRTVVRGDRQNPETIDFDFEPVPHSQGQRYTLAVGILGGPLPHVFLGLTGDDYRPDGELTTNGVPSRYLSDLAMQTSARVRGARLVREMLEQTPQRLLLIAGVAIAMTLWILAVAVAWVGLSGNRPRFWRDVVRDGARSGFLVTAGIAALGIAFLPIVAGR